MSGILARVRRAKRILQILGICTALIGAMALPFPQTNPEFLTQSPLLVWLTMTGASFGQVWS